MVRISSNFIATVLVVMSLFVCSVLELCEQLEFGRSYFFDGRSSSSSSLFWDSSSTGPIERFMPKAQSYNPPSMDQLLKYRISDNLGPYDTGRIINFDWQLNFFDPKKPGVVFPTDGRKLYKAVRDEWGNIYHNFTGE